MTGEAGSGRVRQLTVAGAWIPVILLLGVVLLSAALSPASNWIVRVALAGFCIIAVTRPRDALLVTAALLGFGIILSHLAGVPPLRVSELLVVASIAGYGVRALPRKAPFPFPLTRWFSVPVVLLAMTAIVSTIVWLRVYQLQTGDTPTYLQALLQFFTRNYFVQTGEFSVVVSTAAVLEGLALFVIFASLSKEDSGFFDAAVRMLTVGGAALAFMSIVRLAEILLRNPQVLEQLRATYAGVRISPQIPDYIAAGSYFSLCWVVALGIALASPFRRRLGWVALGLPLIVGLYLTGSRSVIAAALGGLVILAVAVARRRIATVRSVVAFAAIIVVVMVISFPRMIGHDVAGETARQSLTVRAELLQTGLRVMATRPLFGVGIDRFYLVAGGLASPRLNALWRGRKNPHNDFLRVGAELGVVGLALFLWILTGAARRIWRGLRATGDARLAGLAGGLVAFLITMLMSNPLMLREVSFVFWIALGLAVGYSAPLQAPPDADESAHASSRSGVRRVTSVRWPFALLLTGVLVVSIPFRARQELASTDLTRVSYGFFDWATDPDGTRYRWSGREATFFVDGRARVVEIPLSGALPSGGLQRVEIRVNGRPANIVMVGSDWQRLRTLLPADRAPGSHRIDLTVSPTWVPADIVPGSDDGRVLGVKVGEVRVSR